MQITNELIVKIGDGEIVFYKLALNEFAIIKAAREKTEPEERFDLISPRIAEVRNITCPDGSPLTKEKLLEKTLPWDLYTRIEDGWWAEMIKSRNEPEAAAKNESTTA